MVKSLQKLLATYGRHESAAAVNEMRYQLSPRELWAHTYAQWIAIRAGNVAITEQLIQARRAGGAFAGRWCTFQWEDNDFNPIMDAVDRLMSEATL